MTTQTINFEKLWGEFHPKSDLILTPHQRLAEYLASVYEKKKLSTVRNIPIFAESSYIQAIWDTLLLSEPLPRVLSLSQEWALWEKIIRANFSEAETLIDPLELAKIAQDGASILKLWQAEDAFKRSSLSFEQEQFKTWLEAFQSECQNQNYCTLTDRYFILAKMVKQKKALYPRTIYLYGFDDIPPGLRQLLETFALGGTHILQVQTIKPSKTSVCKLAYPDTAAEYYAAANWCYAQLKANPKKKIACIIPSLSEQRQTVLDIFEQVFKQEFRINISIGVSLSSLPVIQSALFLLSKNNIQWAYEDLQILAYNRFIIGYEKEKLARAALCEQLKKYKKYYFTITEIIGLANTVGTPYYAPLFTEQLMHYLVSLENQPVFALPEEWASLFQQQLKNYGWTPNPLFENCLNELRQANFLSTLWTRTQALKHLASILGNHIYQPPKQDAELQILGVLEASGLHFDAVWICGLNEGVFPPHPEPHPFIPYVLQRKLSMPRASIQREYAFCQHVFNRLLQDSSEAILSYALYEGEQHLLESTLIKAVPFSKNNMNIDTPWKKALIDACIQLEYYEDEEAPPLDNYSIHGGTRILELQALCPFRAFAEIRLVIKPQEALAETLSQQERGSLLHQCLETIWSKLKSHKTLLSLSENALFELIEEAIHSALIDMQKEHFSENYLMIERKRLRFILEKWLSYEKQRAEFQVIAVEEAITLVINDIPVHLKIDRIDELADGSRIILDYKTGKSTPNFDWTSARLQGLQLPLYALSQGEKVQAVAMAKVNTKETKFLGLSKEDGMLPEVKAIHSHRNYKDKANWETLLAFWKASLEKLMQDFIEGKANIDPLDPPTTCNYCHLSSLCRYKSL